MSQRVRARETSRRVHDTSRVQLRLCLKAWRAEASRSLLQKLRERVERIERSAARFVRRGAQVEFDEATRRWESRARKEFEERAESIRHENLERTRRIESDLAMELSEERARFASRLERERREALEALESARRTALQNQENAVVAEASMARKDIAHQRAIVSLNAEMARTNVRQGKRMAEMRDTMKSMETLLERQQDRMVATESALSNEMTSAQRASRVLADDDGDDALVGTALVGVPNISEMAEIAASQIAGVLEGKMTGDSTVAAEGVERILTAEISALEKALLHRLEEPSFDSDNYDGE